MPLVGNYIKLEIGILDTVAFDRAVWHPKSWDDPATGINKDVKTLDLHVIELNGEKVNTLLSITSSKLQEQLKPYLDGERYLTKRFTFTQTPGKYQPPRLVSVADR